MTVDTARLRALRTYPQVHDLLRSLMSDLNLIPRNSELVGQLDALPVPMKRALLRAENRNRGWCAWRDAGVPVALTADVSEAASRMQGSPVLQLFLHDCQGRVIGSSGWLQTQLHGWSACEIK